MLTKAEWMALCERELGKPYLWGGEGPVGYDCSGLVQWALHPLRLDPPGDQTAEGLYRFFRAGGRSQPVTIAASQPGDLVFFGSDESIGHIGLAWGEGQMLEAGGGGRTTISIERARAQHAEVRIRPIDHRPDLVEILRPTALAWPTDDVERLEAAEEFGRFEGAPPLTEWLPDGRNMRLKRALTFFQNSGRDWFVPEDAIVDGASIPRVFWSLIGGPFEGPYRDASIVHDHYCDTKTRTWKDTHRVFYDAMRCSGVSEGRAEVMYYAVYRFGPRWRLESSAVVEGLEAVGEFETQPTPMAAETFDPESFTADATEILRLNLGADAIEALADARSLKIGGASPPDVLIKGATL